MTILLLQMSFDPTLSFPDLLRLKIEDEQATSWLENTSNFGKSLTFEFLRQMVHLTFGLFLVVQGHKRETVFIGTPIIRIGVIVASKHLSAYTTLVTNLSVE